MLVQHNHRSLQKINHTKHQLFVYGSLSVVYCFNSHATVKTSETVRKKRSPGIQTTLYVWRHALVVHSNLILLL